MAHLSINNRWLGWIPAVVFAGLLFCISTLPGEQMPQVNWLSSPDKIGHFLAYGLFTIVLSWPLSRLGIRSQWLRLGLAFGLSSIYGILMEYVQFRFFPSRYFEVWDIVANISGALCAAVLLGRINFKFLSV